MEVRFARCPIEIARTGPSDFTCGMRKKSFDPDGIRTRVAALKGPCPRPLDDGASFDAQINQFAQERAQYADASMNVNVVRVFDFRRSWAERP